MQVYLMFSKHLMLKINGMVLVMNLLILFLFLMALSKLLDIAIMWAEMAMQYQAQDITVICNTLTLAWRVVIVFMEKLLPYNLLHLF